MKSFGPRAFNLLLVLTLAGQMLTAGVNKEIENEYKALYENKALFLKIPVRGERQVLYIRGNLTVPDQSNLGDAVSFKVAEQIRITKVDFKDAGVEFTFSSLDLSRRGLVVFQFAGSLDFSFPQRPTFDSVLKNTFTEGLSYDDLEKAKESYIRDQFNRTVRQFADTTETSSDFVIKAVLQESAEYANLKKQYGEVTSKAADLEKRLAEESETRQRLETQLRGSRTDLESANNTNSELRRERDQLAQERSRLSREVTDLKSANDNFQKQVNSVAQKLNVQLDSNSQLGRQVDTLSETIGTLRKERDEFSSKARDLDVKVGSLTKERDGLKQDLSGSERRVSRLESDLKALTSNRNSLESTYLRLKREKEGFDAAQMVETAFRLERTTEERETGTYLVAQLYLKSKVVGVLETQVPAKPGDSFEVKFKTASPDTVQFTEEERQLFETLGQKLNVEIRMNSWSGALTPVLKQGQAKQEIPAREEGLWVWELQGIADQPETASLQAWITDSNGHSILFANQELEVSPSGALAGILSSFSLVSAGIGFLLGLAVLGVVFVIMGRKQPARPEPERRPTPYSTSKKL